jgi:hypothetical protein
MKIIFKKLWRALVVLWTVLGALVSISFLLTVLYALGAPKWNFGTGIGIEEYCHRYKVGSPFKAVDLSSDWHQVQLMTGRLVSPIGTLVFTRTKLSDEDHQKGIAFLRRIDELGLDATVWLTDTLFLMKKTCEISFEHGFVTKVDYRIWD